MREVFVDTFFWIALANSRDPHHQRAEALQQSLRSVRLVTTDEVLVEFLTFFAGYGSAMRQSAAQAVRRLLTAPTIEVIPQARTSLLAGLTLYEARPDKGYSLTDCISMETMRGRGIGEVLTDDHHFAQEGFIRIFY
jgi:predicted nucleic acid-binding protein